MSLLNQDNKDSKIKLPDVDMTQAAGKATEVAGEAAKVAGQAGKVATKVAGQAAGKAAEIVKGIDFAQILENIWTVIKAIIGLVFGFVRRLGFWGTIELVCGVLALAAFYFIAIQQDYNTGAPLLIISVPVILFIEDRRKKNR